MSGLNLTTFFSYIRNLPFGGRLTESQVGGVNSILAAFRQHGSNDVRHLAYILATAFHETGGHMVPVREEFSKTDAEARRKLAKYKYVIPDPETGHSYYGRGHVQLTWAANYKVMGTRLGLPLYQNPDLALEVETSARILVDGMINGIFTGHALRTYFNGAINDPLGARRVVNGTDKAILIEGYHKAFLGALEEAMDGGQPADVKPEDAQPDRPNLLKDQTTWGTVSAVASSGIFGMFTAINSPWALGALVVLLVAAGVFWYGRNKIIKTAGA